MTTLRIKRLNFSETLKRIYPITNFINEYNSAFIGITDDDRSVYDMVLLKGILEKHYIPEGFTPNYDSENEIYYYCQDEIDFLQDLWNQMFQTHPPIIARNVGFSYKLLKKVKIGKWFDLPSVGL